MIQTQSILIKFLTHAVQSLILLLNYEKIVFQTLLAPMKSGGLLSSLQDTDLDHNLR